MIRITVYADNDIEDVSALEVETILREKGIGAERTRVTRLTEKQYQKGLDAR